MQAQLIAEEKVKRVQHLKYKNQQTKIFALWEVYIVKTIWWKGATLWGQKDLQTMHTDLNWYSILLYILLLFSI